MPFMEYIQRYTLADYAQWPRDWELIQGQPVAMTPSPGVSHQRTSLKIARQLDEQLDCKIDDFCFGSWFFDIRGCSGRLDFSKVWVHSSGERAQVEEAETRGK